jgi:hypothetical protein
MRAQIQIAQLNIMVEDSTDYRDNTIYQLKLSMQREFKAKIKLQKTEIINEYSTLLSDRETFKRQSLEYQKSLESHYWRQSTLANILQLLDGAKLRCHHDYKML